MEQIEKIREFSREFVNGTGRTPERKQLIRETYLKLFGERLRINCVTCYIDAIFKIINNMEKQPCKYRLKKGALLSAFGDATKTMSNANITDELAEWHLTHTKGAASLFAILPEFTPPQDLEIVPVDDTLDLDEPVKTTKKTANKKKK